MDRSVSHSSRDEILTAKKEHLSVLCVFIKFGLLLAEKKI